MKIPLYQVDAFGDGLFSGNPACVCPLNEWLEDELLQKIAAENNVPETAFFVKEEGGFHLRWFTPTVEIHLCGHATLASAHVLYQYLGFEEEEIKFSSMSGPLRVIRGDGFYTLDFPVQELKAANMDEHLISALKALPNEAFETDYYFLVYESREQIEAMDPDFEQMVKSPAKGVLASAPGRTVDYVYRFFAPKMGIPEDPATGSAQTMLMPFWSDRFNKKKMNSLQLSKRGGKFECKLVDDRVLISGKAVTYFEGEISL